MDRLDRPALRIVRRPATPVVPPVLDPSQQRVVDRVAAPGCGPLLVLAGPGTGKTTTLVEAVAARVEAGTSPERILTLTFSRKAAQELRDRIGTRLGRTVETQSAWTFHAFCLALVSEGAGLAEPGRRLRLLSGPEHDLRLRELLAGGLEHGTVTWPPDLLAAVPTRGFADEVRTLLARARGLAMEPDELVAVSSDRADWRSVAAFLDEYLAVLDASGELDYAELVHRAVVHAESAEGRSALRSRFDLVVVDEYQDTDAGQERLLRAVAGDGRDLVAVGDPDQSIYAFRGADVRGLLEFCDRFPTSQGERAEVLTLGVSRRAGHVLLQASREVARRMPLTGAGLTTHLRAHRALDAAPSTPEGQVEVLTFPSRGSELEAVADVLRREHLEGGTPWSSMAVLVRSGAQSVPTLRRVLGAAGVPLQVAGDELPLAREAAVAPLLLALRCALDADALTVEAARALLLSPLGGADAVGLRRLGRELRAVQRQAAPDVMPRPSSELVRDAVADTADLTLVDERVARPAARLGTLLASARAAAESDFSPYDVLWGLWSGTPWPRRLEAASAGGGPDARSADRDLDAVCALFDQAARADERDERRGVADFLAEVEAQQIPGDSLAEAGVRPDAVRLLTAHRAKGLEWDVVVVPQVQDGLWPDVRRRGSLLEADRLSSSGPLPPATVSELMAEERRLFYVAVTRARRRLVVTAVDSPEDDGVRPSRFLSELGVPVVSIDVASRRPLTVPGLVAELRAAASSPSSSDELRAAAVDRLAALAAAVDDGVPLVRAADPTTWWGLHDLTDPEVPMHPPEVVLQMSGSSIDRFTDCPLRWFLEHEVHARSSRSTALGFGSLVHAIADDVAHGRSPADPDALMALLDKVWGQLAFEARWQSEQQRTEAKKAIERFLSWHEAERGRRLVATEHRFEVQFVVGDRTVVLRGSMDRVEVDADGHVHVVDLKTGRTKPTGDEVDKHVQLGVYQLAVRVGALDDADSVGTATTTSRVTAGAELVQLRQEKPKAPGTPLVQRQPALHEAEDPDWVEDLVRLTAESIVSEEFPPTPNQYCRMCDFRRVCPADDAGRQVVR